VSKKKVAEILKKKRERGCLIFEHEMRQLEELFGNKTMHQIPLSRLFSEL